MLCLCETGPVVQLSTSSINFMQIDEGETATRTVDVVNTSDIDAVYQVRRMFSHAMRCSVIV